VPARRGNPRPIAGHAAVKGVGLLVFTLLGGPVQAELRTENVILVTFDGVRTQELFEGMDADIAAHHEQQDGYSEIPELRKKFWRDSPEQRREVLMPFFWKQLAPMGVVLGNHGKGSSMQARNAVLWSSPGYTEIMTGQAQPEVVDNALVRYPHRTVMDHVRSTLRLDGSKVVQIGSWNGFRTAASATDGGFTMIGAYDPVPAPLATPEMELLGSIRREVMELWEEGSNDALTYRLAEAYLREHRPRFMWLAFSQSDDWAHAGRYDRLLAYLHLADDFLRRLWTALQSMDDYHDRTTLVITTDHGRGLTAADWLEHDSTVPGSRDTWVAVIGPDTPDRGEVAPATTVYLSDIAATLLQFFGIDYRQFNPAAGPPIPDTLTIDQNDRRPR